MGFRSELLVNKTAFKPQKFGDLLVCVDEDYFPMTGFYIGACRSDAEYARKENRESRAYMRGGIEIARPQPKVFYRAKSPKFVRSRSDLKSEGIKMRINNKVIKDAEISVVAERKVQSLKGVKAIFTYEARVKKKERTYKKQSEDLGLLQNWILTQTGAA